jgi:hypothetical protein
MAAADLGGMSSPAFDFDRFAALVGAGSATFSALVALIGFELALRRDASTQRAMMVVAGIFLLRLLLVAVGATVVHLVGGSLGAFAFFFFVPYFVFQAIEGMHVHGLSRRPASRLDLPGEGLAQDERDVLIEVAR